MLWVTSIKTSVLAVDTEAAYEPDEAMAQEPLEVTCQAVDSVRTL